MGIGGVDYDGLKRGREGGGMKRVPEHIRGDRR